MAAVRPSSTLPANSAPGEACTASGRPLRRVVNCSLRLVNSSLLFSMRSRWISAAFRRSPAADGRDGLAALADRFLGRADLGGRLPVGVPGLLDRTAAKLRFLAVGSGEQILRRHRAIPSLNAKDRHYKARTVLFRRFRDPVSVPAPIVAEVA
jgi:hypothetical protein